MVDSDGQTFIRHLIANVKCAVCNRQYEPDDIQIIERHEELWILGVMCSECETQGLIFAIIREVSTEAAQSSEPDAEDQAVEEPLPIIDKDDILDMHCLLRDFKGDMYDLLVLAD